MSSGSAAAQGDAGGQTDADLGHEPGTGRLAMVTAPGASLAYAYDGSLLMSEAWIGSVQGAVTWTYDTDFRITNEAVRNAFSVTFGYTPPIRWRRSAADRAPRPSANTGSGMKRFYTVFTA